MPALPDRFSWVVGRQEGQGGGGGQGGRAHPAMAWTSDIFRRQLVPASASSSSSVAVIIPKNSSPSVRHASCSASVPANALAQRPGTRQSDATREKSPGQEHMRVRWEAQDGSQRGALLGVDYLRVVPSSRHSTSFTSLHRSCGYIVAQGRATA